MGGGTVNGEKKLCEGPPPPHYEGVPHPIDPDLKYKKQKKINALWRQILQ